MRWARLRHASMSDFANALRRGMGWKSPSHASIYAWEADTTRIPAAALVAATRMGGLSVDELLERSRASTGRHPAVLSPSGSDVWSFVEVCRIPLESLPSVESGDSPGGWLCLKSERGKFAGGTSQADRC